MPTTRLLIAGLAAGVIANITGYLITGWLFHPYQERTPATWRASEGWQHYLYATLIRIAACAAIALFYGALHPLAASQPWVCALAWGVLLGAVTLLPLILEAALFVNWHRGFVAGLLLDWLIVCALACAAAQIALRA